jgi:hypothetical protein
MPVKPLSRISRCKLELQKPRAAGNVLCMLCALGSRIHELDGAHLRGKSVSPEARAALAITASISCLRRAFILLTTMRFHAHAEQTALFANLN